MNIEWQESRLVDLTTSQVMGIIEEFPGRGFFYLDFSRPYPSNPKYFTTVEAAQKDSRTPPVMLPQYCSPDETVHQMESAR